MLDILRDGQPMTLKMTLGERPSDLSAHVGVGGGVQEGALRGIEVENLTPALRDQSGHPRQCQWRGYYAS